MQPNITWDGSMTKHFSKVKVPTVVKSDIWNSLKFVTRIPSSRIKSIMTKRDQIKTKLTEQILLATDRSYVPTKNKWITEVDGHVRRISVPVKVRRWWSEVEGGKIQVSVYYKGKPLELEAGKNAIEINSPNELVPTLRLLQKSIDLGDFDVLFK